MNVFTRSLLIIAIALIGISCSDDSDPDSTSDSGFWDEQETSLGLFNEFLKINESSFVSSGTGFNFVDQDWCNSPSETNIDGTYYDLQNLQCYKGPYQNFQKTFYMANVIDHPSNGNTLFLTFQYGYWTDQSNEPPATGTYPSEFFCSWVFCYRNFVLTLYTVDRQGQVIAQYDGITDAVHVVNENNVVSVSFDALFYNFSGEERFPISATLACCN